jgi:hypothetical protein
MCPHLPKKIHPGIKFHDSAEEVRKGFEKDGLAYDNALAGLDAALLLPPRVGAEKVPGRARPGLTLQLA